MESIRKTLCCLCCCPEVGPIFALSQRQSWERGAEEWQCTRCPSKFKVKYTSSNKEQKRLTVPGDHHFLSRRLVSFGLAANHSGEITKLATVPLIPGGGKGFLPAAAASDFLVFLVGNGGALRKAASMDEALFSTPFTSWFSLSEIKSFFPSATVSVRPG